MRIGILGGSFDPVHFGHLLLAECCREQRQLDRVWFVPAADPPHKVRQLQASGRQRAEMLELAVADHDPFQLNRLELDRGGVSYTVETLAALARWQPDMEPFLLMGADTLADLPNWYQPAEVCRLATLVVVRRAGAPEPDFGALEGVVTPRRLDELRTLQVEMPLVAFSSSEIRRRVAAGKSIRYLAPSAVVRYIGQQGLYRTDH